MSRLNDHAQVVTKYLAQRLIDLRGHGLTPQPLAELRFDHMECGFHVRSLVIVAQEFFAVLHVEMVHAIPQS